jgi:hypothetical protein
MAIRTLDSFHENILQQIGRHFGIASTPADKFQKIAAYVGEHALQVAETQGVDIGIHSTHRNIHLTHIPTTPRDVQKPVVDLAIKLYRQVCS